MSSCFTHWSASLLAADAWSGTLLLLLSDEEQAFTTEETSAEFADEPSACVASLLCSSETLWASSVISSSWTAGGTHWLSSLLRSSVSSRSLSCSANFSNSLNVWKTDQITGMLHELYMDIHFKRNLYQCTWICLQITVKCLVWTFNNTV